ncbi:hypothetical protein B0T11DRAFT_287996 [Plectosphaerella cucumerina]|uniref:Zn(2)-C6 fungal-type domain-containing protein n=1 Tax=Plectosphaerella cucumerina TaxID=40658 RepID=A0A8K0T906_9PEZI|nr:hypothetical protein B0T11DRAFT_287996 [Plectosphaerella cucumerina]
MVYCGKASEGCQNCRKRRIKCDKAKPECSQCVRQAMQCPGYRDQLSLMFRDESTKVIRKAHAQWGLDSPSTSGEAVATGTVAEEPDMTTPQVTSERRGSRTQTGHTSSEHKSPVKSRRPSSASSPISQTGSAQVAPPCQAQKKARSSSLSTSPPAATRPNALSEMGMEKPSLSLVPIGPTIEEQGVHFYVNRYLVGLPDEPKSTSDITASHWIWNPALQHIAAAIGLAGLSNLTGNAEMMAAARMKYGRALRQTGQLIQPPNSPSLDVTMRSVVMLAMYEVVKGTHHAHGTVHAHVMGGAALIRSWIPLPNAPFGGFRALIQLSYSIFIPIQVAGMEVPRQLFDWIAVATQLQYEIDRPATDLAVIIARFLQISAFVESQVLSDGRPKTSNAIHQLLDLDADMAAWAAGLQGVWLYQTEKAPHLSSRALFRGEYHVYYDVLIARTWNYFRWARILVNQILVDLVDKYPASSLRLVSVIRRNQALRTIRRLAKETLVSTPSHWRHPLLEDTRITVENAGGGGAGAAGIPALLFQLKVASCSPGVPREYWQWALDIITTIWGDMGMLYARIVIEAMRAHQDNIQRGGADGILAENW